MRQLSGLSGGKELDRADSDPQLLAGVQIHGRFTFAGRLKHVSDIHTSVTTP